jgi:hypothetical protein
MGEATHRHVMSGREYVLIGYGRMQSETWQVPVPFTRLGLVDKANMREVAVYRSVDDGSLWVHPREEFEDGRFIKLSEVSHEH